VNTEGGPSSSKPKYVHFHVGVECCLGLVLILFCRVRKVIINHNQKHIAQLIQSHKAERLRAAAVKRLTDAAVQAISSIFRKWRKQIKE
jgi:hypothetical protein